MTAEFGSFCGPYKWLAVGLCIGNGKAAVFEDAVEPCCVANERYPPFASNWSLHREVVSAPRATLQFERHDLIIDDRIVQPEDTAIEAVGSRICALGLGPIFVKADINVGTTGSHRTLRAEGRGGRPMECARASEAADNTRARIEEPADQIKIVA
ncbi:hypothetical protein RSO01_88140 [Reyranella soli]|uniref:Uncharacterized protein n=1 Tax=Reyranella soli TaxID=1230389 RepID=A0A512NRR5_9HYPH|nr:hypothetical protein RSO01_88140 [Reyranella soli]